MWKSRGYGRAGGMGRYTRRMVAVEIGLRIVLVLYLLGYRVKSLPIKKLSIFTLCDIILI